MRLLLLLGYCLSINSQEANSTKVPAITPTLSISQTNTYMSMPSGKDDQQTPSYTTAPAEAEAVTARPTRTASASTTALVTKSQQMEPESPRLNGPQIAGIGVAAGFVGVIVCVCLAANNAKPPSPVLSSAALTSTELSNIVRNPMDKQQKQQQQTYEYGWTRVTDNTDVWYISPRGESSWTLPPNAVLTV